MTEPGDIQLGDIRPGNILDVVDLAVTYRTVRGLLTAVDGVDLSVAPGETLGLVGESGCGKSSLGKSIVQLVPPSRGQIRIAGIDPAGLRGTEKRAFRRRAQMVFQDPMGSLDPRRTIGASIAAPLAVHGLSSRAERREQVLGLMTQVGLRPDQIDRLPHEISGGQRQRVGIARALALDPALIVCDEPVSALDLSLQAQVLNLFARLQAERGVAYLFVSHDLSVVEHIAQRVAVMYLGRIVEIAEAESLWRRPAHPYTKALIDAVPRLDPGAQRLAERPILGGDLPSPYAPPPGCRFSTRCPAVQPVCRTLSPVLQDVAPGHRAACHLLTPP